MGNKYYIYDIEVYPNVFTFAVSAYGTGLKKVFEYSDRVNELPIFLKFLNSLHVTPNCYMVGFNNIGYDYPVIHHIFKNQCSIQSPYDIYKFSDKLIKADKNQKFKMMCWPADRVVKQVDLYKINHFDNQAKSTSLKIIEFNQWAGWLQELPFKPGTVLNHQQIDDLKDYNLHRDVKNTESFFTECLPDVEFRQELTKKYNIDFDNHNDSKIGGDYLTLKILESKFGPVRNSFDFYKYRKRLGKTPRPGIVLQDIILPYIKFRHPKFDRILKWLKSVSIIKTKDCFKDLSVTIDGCSYDFGTGGIHGCTVPKKSPPQLFKSDEHYVIIDVDVASYYPNLAISNSFYPKHLGEVFCKAYSDLYQKRKKHPKGSVLNLLFKLALNGTYGNSNSEYSIFYDPKFTMSITINGQLLLCLLTEWIMLNCCDCKMIQINTDGLTVRLPRLQVGNLKNVCRQWEKLTGLVLEDVSYSKMLIKDVNNYAALKESGGKPKLKGKYEYDKPHHKNQSALVVPKVIEECFLSDNYSQVDKLVYGHDNIMDFMLRAKIPKSSRLELGGKVIQNVSRYYISTNGDDLVKVMPPLARNPEKERPIGINIGWKVTECNEIIKADPSTIEYEYYIQEARKLICNSVITK